jgi:hypothetical protein
MFIKLDHFNYINENKKGCNVVGTKFGTQENHIFTFTPPWLEDDYCPHSIFHNLLWEWYPNGMSQKPHESGSLEIWNFGLLKFWEVITFFKYVQLKHICDLWSCIFFKNLSNTILNSSINHHLIPWWCFYWVFQVEFSTSIMIFQMTIIFGH